MDRGGVELSCVRAAPGENGGGGGGTAGCPRMVLATCGGRAGAGGGPAGGGPRGVAGAAGGLPTPPFNKFANVTKLC